MRALCVVTLTVFCFLSTSVGAQDGVGSTCNETCVKMKKIFANQAVLSVHTTGKQGLGTGMLILLDDELRILTNNHVIEGAEKIWISFYRAGFKHEVSLVGRDPAADLALLTAPPIPSGVTAVKFAKSLEIAEQVYALGYPFGVRIVTLGYVNGSESFTWLYGWTQTPINPGNSGGPLFNENHELVGVNTAIVPGATVGFVIPVQYIKMLLPRLLRERIVRHGSLGFDFHNASDLLPTFFSEHGLNYPPAKDTIVVEATNSHLSSATAGIQAGDSVVKLNGTPLRNAHDLDKRVFFFHRPDDKVMLTVERGPQTFEREIKLIEYVSPFAEMQKKK